MEQRARPWERASEQPAWYDDQPYNIGDRVEIVDAAEQTRAGAGAGRVVGYDASGPHPDEDFIRVLVMPDCTPATIVALPPAAIIPERAESERTGIARSLLAGLEQHLPPERFDRLLQWFTGAACRDLLDDPHLSVKNIRLGGLSFPGLLLPELVQLAAQRLVAPANAN